MLCDLWSYSIEEKTWEFLAGKEVCNEEDDPKDYPGSRAGSLTWFDNVSDMKPRLWLYGGVRLDHISPDDTQEYYADLWYYSFENGKWECVILIF